MAHSVFRIPPSPFRIVSGLLMTFVCMAKIYLYTIDLQFYFEKFKSLYSRVVVRFAEKFFIAGSIPIPR